MQIYKVTILLDKNNNWLETHLLNSSLINKNNKFQLKISHNHMDIKDQDLVFILGYTKILDINFLKLNRLNLVIHESDLPRGKGFSPVQWQILEGANFIPVRLIEATDQVDSGDIFYKHQFELHGHELHEEIREIQAKATIDVIINFLKIYPNHSRVKQDGSVTFYRKRRPDDGELDIDANIRSQFNKLRIGNNEEWPSFFYLHGRKYILKIYSE